MNVTHPPTNYPGCPETFDADVETVLSQSAYDRATVDASGQHPTLADQLDAQGVPLLVAQRETLLAQPNPAWTPTFERVVLDEPVEHQVARCPNCNSPIKVG